MRSSRTERMVNTAHLNDPPKRFFAYVRWCVTEKCPVFRYPMFWPASSTCAASCPHAHCFVARCAPPRVHMLHRLVLTSTPPRVHMHHPPHVHMHHRLVSTCTVPRVHTCTAASCPHMHYRLVSTHALPPRVHTSTTVSCPHMHTAS